MPAHRSAVFWHAGVGALRAWGIAWQLISPLFPFPFSLFPLTFSLFPFPFDLPLRLRDLGPGQQTGLLDDFRDLLFPFDRHHVHARDPFDLPEPADRFHADLDAHGRLLLLGRVGKTLDHGIRDVHAGNVLLHELGHPG